MLIRSQPIASSEHNMNKLREEERDKGKENERKRERERNVSTYWFAYHVNVMPSAGPNTWEARVQGLGPTKHIIRELGWKLSNQDSNLRHPYGI